MALEAFQKQLLEATEVANEDIQCPALHYNYSVIRVVRRE